MKKNTAIIFFAIVIAIICSCSPEKRNASKFAKYYLEAVGNYHFDEVEKYAGDLVFRQLQNAKLFVQYNMDSTALANNLPVSIEIDNVNFFQDTARVEFTSKSPIRTNKGYMIMVKNDTAWTVLLQDRIPEKKD